MDEKSSRIVVTSVLMLIVLTFAVGILIECQALDAFQEFIRSVFRYFDDGEIWQR